MNLDDKITENFTWREALYLPSWKIYHTPSPAEIANIQAMAAKLELIRSYLGEHPVNVNCWIRPRAVNCPMSDQWNGRNYNMFVGGAQMSAHITGSACDFTVSTITCNDVREHLVPMLEQWNIRMENKLNAGWVHCDIYPPNPNRFFKP